MVYRFQLTYVEIIDILDLKYIPSRRTGNSFNQGMYEITYVNTILKHILANNVKVIITIDDIRLKSNLNINQTLIFTKNKFFHTILDFFQSYSGELIDNDGFIQLIPGSNKSDKTINITGLDKIRLKCDYVNESIVNGVREPILYNFALDKPPGHKIYKEPRINLFKKVNKSFLFRIQFYLEDDDDKPVDINNEKSLLLAK